MCLMIHVYNFFLCLLRECTEITTVIFHKDTFKKRLCVCGMFCHRGLRAWLVSMKRKLDVVVSATASMRVCTARPVNLARCKFKGRGSTRWKSALIPALEMHQ